jgi:dienelactone hydrolase
MGVADIDQFKAAIAIYPWCEISTFPNVPLLVLIGESDDWAPAIRCSRYLKSVSTEHEVILKVYPGAYHDFDWEGTDEIYEGHRLLYDPIAAKDAIVQVKSFLAKHFR